MNKLNKHTHTHTHTHTHANTHTHTHTHTYIYICVCVCVCVFVCVYIYIFFFFFLSFIFIFFFFSFTSHFRHRWSGAGLPPHGLRRYKGLRYMAVTRSFVQFALYNPIAKDLLAWCRNTSLPEETFFTTLNHNWRVSAPGGYLGIEKMCVCVSPPLGAIYVLRRCVCVSPPLGAI